MGRQFMEALFQAAIKRVDPCEMVKARIRYLRGELLIQNDSETLKIELSAYDRILICGAGKASAPMAAALEEILEEYRGAVEGIVSVKYGHTVPTSYIRLKEAGHPVPDENSMAAGIQIAGMLESADKRSLVLNLISGGGSALLARPYPGLRREHIQEMTRILLECGADIAELNTLRKHLSGIKGGRLAELAYPARLVNVLLSDVVGDDPGFIASGPGVPDKTSFADVWAVIKKYNLEAQLPRQIIEHFYRGLEDPALETPKPGDPVFDSVSTVVLGNNRAALEAAAAYARNEGVETLILSSMITGEAREIAKVFSAIALDPPAKGMLIIAGGETTVTIRGNGLGGRNQELALSYVIEILNSGRKTNAAFLAAGSDGNDGPTDAAGAIILPEDLERLAQGPDPLQYIQRNDSCHYLASQKLLFKTGPTNTNVCDFCFLYLPA